ncbi:hypothetical protein C0993_004324, partial [Termitomyces sp. T159_Od127]
MTQPVTSGAPLDASAPENEAWNRLLALETQVQTTQASLTLHTTELAGLRQATDTIAHSLQALLERLPSPPTAAPTLSPPAEATSVPPFKASTVSHTNIPRPALSDAYD